MTAEDKLSTLWVMLTFYKSYKSKHRVLRMLLENIEYLFNEEQEEETTAH